MFLFFDSLFVSFFFFLFHFALLRLLFCILQMFNVCMRESIWRSFIFLRFIFFFLFLHFRFYAIESMHFIISQIYSAKQLRLSYHEVKLLTLQQFQCRFFFSLSCRLLFRFRNLFNKTTFSFYDSISKTEKRNDLLMPIIERRYSTQRFTLNKWIFGVNKKKTTTTEHSAKERVSETMTKEEKEKKIRLSCFYIRFGSVAHNQLTKPSVKIAMQRYKTPQREEKTTFFFSPGKHFSNLK